MKIKSEKGFTGIDITVAIIIILLFMSLISVLFFNITKSSKNIDRKSEATYIATTIIEEFKARDYKNIIPTGENNWVKVQNSNTSTGILYNDIQISDAVHINDGYTCELQIYNYVPEDKKDGSSEEDYNDLVKVIKVRVSYKVGRDIEEVELTTSRVREF